ncbi:TPA: flippase [Photobacterium damselae]
MSNIIKNAILYGSERVIFLLIGIFTNIIVARSIDVNDFGILNTAYSLTGILGFLFGMGVELTLIKLIVENKDKARTYIESAIILRLIGSLIATLIFLIFYNCFYESKVLLYASLLLIFASTINSLSVIDCYYQAVGNANLSTKAKLYSRCIAFIFQILISILSPNVLYFAAANVVMSISLVIIQLYYLPIRKVNKVKDESSFDIILKIFKLSWPIALSSVAVSIFLQSDIIILSKLKTNIEVAHYAAVTRLMIPIGFIAYAITQAYYPKLISNHKNKEEYKKAIIKLNALLFYSSILLATLISALSYYIMLVVYGERYSISSPLLSLMSMSIIFSFLGAVVSKMLVIKGEQKHELFKSSFSAILNIILNIILIPKFSIYGAAFASIVSLFFANSFYFIFNKKLRYVFLWQIEAILYIPKTFMMRIYYVLLK